MEWWSEGAAVARRLWRAKVMECAPRRCLRSAPASGAATPARPTALSSFQPAEALHLAAPGGWRAPGQLRASPGAHPGLLSPCNPRSSILNPQSAAFTLIELLVVIAIIAVLAAMVVGGASVAVAISHKSRAQAELASLSAAIDAYKLKRGSYPPSNPSNAPTTPFFTTHSSLFYELTGTITTNLGNSQTFHSPLTQEVLTQPAGGAGPTSVQGLFGTGGFNNSSPDPTEIQNFYPAMKNFQHGALYVSGSSGPTYTLMIVSIHGPRDFPAASSQIYNFWHYVSSANAQPVHNRDTYDLWVDIVIRGKTNRISNWSKDPEIVNDWQD